MSVDIRANSFTATNLSCQTLSINGSQPVSENSMISAISSACPYGVVSINLQNNEATLVDGALNTLTLATNTNANLHVPSCDVGKMSDCLIEITVPTGITLGTLQITVPSGSTKESRVKLTDDETIEVPSSGSNVYTFFYQARRMDNGTGTQSYRLYSSQKKGTIEND